MPTYISTIIVIIVIVIVIINIIGVSSVILPIEIINRRAIAIHASASIFHTFHLLLLLFLHILVVLSLINDQSLIYFKIVDNNNNNNNNNNLNHHIPYRGGKPTAIVTSLDVMTKCLAVVEGSLHLRTLSSRISFVAITHYVSILHVLSIIVLYYIHFNSICPLICTIGGCWQLAPLVCLCFVNKIWDFSSFSLSFSHRKHINMNEFIYICPIM